MNIVIFAAVDFPAGPATTSRVKHIAKILTMAGNRVTVASIQANTKIPYPDNACTEGEFENIRYIYLSGSTVRPSGLREALADTWKGCIGAGAFLRRLKREQGVDVVVYYTPDFLIMLPSLVLTKLYGIPTILELCEIYSVGYVANFRQRIRVLLASLTDRLLPRICSGIIVISTTIKKKLLLDGIAEKKIFHLPILVDYREYQEVSTVVIPSLAGRKYFLNSGGLGEKDGLGYLVSALALVRRQGQDVCLVCTGDSNGVRKQQLLELAREAGVEGEVIVTGFLSRGQLIWAYQHATALLCCRIKGPFASYGSPTKLSEYLASGKPVITNELGDNGLYLSSQKSAFFAEAEDSASIAQQMLLIVNQPELARAVGREGQKVAETVFHYENYVSSLGGFLRGLSG